MARRPLKRGPSVTITIIDDPILEALNESVRIRTVLIDDAESMVIFDEKSPVWKTKKIGGRATFVTLKPPPDASDSLIDEIKTKLYAEHGARVVHVHTKQKPIVVTKEIEERSSINPRVVVLAMVEEANTKDREALRARIEHSLAAVGL